MRYDMVVATAAMMMAGCATVNRQQSDETAVQRQDCIETRCVVTYHLNDSPYWTDQRQRFCPASVVMDAWGTEPEGTWRCTYNKGQFSSSGLNRTYMKSLPAGLMNAMLAELLYMSFTAGGGFEPAGLTPGESVGIEGRRYESFRLGRVGAGHTLTVYQNVATGRMELLRLTDGKDIDWLAQSYNLRFNARLNRMMPRKIDIFDMRQGIAAKKLLIEFDYIDVQ